MRRADPSGERHLGERHRKPPSEMSCTAVNGLVGDEAAHKIAVAPLGREIDRRRCALLAPANLAQIERLAEPAARLADQRELCRLAA